MEVPRGGLGGALDGDVVTVRETGAGRRQGGTPRVRVLEVTERERDGACGVLRRGGGRLELAPLDPALPRTIPVADTPEAREAPAGSVVYARLEERGRELRAVVDSRVGGGGEPSSYMASVLLDAGIRTEFPEDVLREAEAAAAEPVTAEGRDDMTAIPTVTVDPPDARDFDDAISLERRGDGYVLHVHIADVAAYVRPGTLLDAEAESRGTSVYLPDRVVPMLPEVLSASACSLVPGEVRPARTVSMELSPDGSRTGATVHPTLIRSDARLTYREALDLMRGAPGDATVSELLQAAREVSRLLDRRREERGALDLGGLEYRVVLGRGGWPVDFEPVVQDESHRLIENFMVEANAAVAELCRWSELPVLYRVHDEPSGEAATKLLQSLSEIGLELPGARLSHPAGLRDALESLGSQPLRDMAREAILKSLRRAEYSPRCTGHYGLALESYMHFTSPIRRYPDLLVHQVLATMEAGGSPPGGEGLEELAAAMSRTERAAEVAERDSVELMALLYLSKRRGSEWDAAVSDVLPFGVFCRLDGVPVEGLVPAGAMRRSAVPFDRGGSLPERGRAIRVAVASSDPMERKLELRPADSGRKR